MTTTIEGMLIYGRSLLRVLVDLSTTNLWRSFGLLWSQRKLDRARESRDFWREMGRSLWFVDERGAE